MTRLYGRAAAGARVRDWIPAAIWHSTTMIAAVSADGPRAPFMLEGAVDGAAFRVYVEHVLVSALSPGDIVMMDNLATHKDRAAREAILAAGCQVLDLPPYSPELNPIEKMWSKVKASLRGSKARCFEDLSGAMAAALGAVTREDIRG